VNVAALIVAAGKGERAGGGLPKQFTRVGGIALVARCVDAFAAHPAINEVHVVIGAGQEALLDDALDGRAVTAVTIGGAERRDSVKAGLAALSGVDIVLIHDAARPFLPVAVIDRLLAALETADGAVPALPVVDTLAVTGETLGDVVDRSRLIHVQTPQGFTYPAIMTSHQRWNGSVATDDAQMARAAGFQVVAVEGDRMLDKITHPADFAAAEARLAGQMMSRTGMGFDVHRLEAGPALWLCGVEIPHDKGLAGHSDADVALHALTDALLGAIAAGDIGDHFPPSDVRWRGAPSHHFLTFARDLIVSTGGSISHVDLTIMCEAPKIAPHRAAMRDRIAALLGLPLSRVSVKATTTERLGFTGRGEGIAAQAIATVLMKDNG
jgi:2-C-methyl-D-erythritol 4-phosphate cytidylyltransferase / 2-C-methyl-D-erythritol 2,4-cyclodiphosphate synthase